MWYSKSCYLIFVLEIYNQIVVVSHIFSMLVLSLLYISLILYELKDLIRDKMTFLGISISSSHEEKCTYLPVLKDQIWRQVLQRAQKCGKEADVLNDGRKTKLLRRIAYHSDVLLMGGCDYKRKAENEIEGAERRNPKRACNSKVCDNEGEDNGAVGINTLMATVIPRRPGSTKSKANSAISHYDKQYAEWFMWQYKNLGSRLHAFKPASTSVEKGIRDYCSSMKPTSHNIISEMIHPERAEPRNTSAARM